MTCSAVFQAGGLLVVLVEVARKAYLASLVPVIVDSILNEHQVVADIVAFVGKGDFPRSRLGEKQRGKILASWVSRKMRTVAQFAIKDSADASSAAQGNSGGVTDPATGELLSGGNRVSVGSQRSSGGAGGQGFGLSSLRNMEHAPQILEQEELDQQMMNEISALGEAGLVEMPAGEVRQKENGHGDVGADGESLGSTLPGNGGYAEMGGGPERDEEQTPTKSRMGAGMGLGLHDPDRDRPPVPGIKPGSSGRDGVQVSNARTSASLAGGPYAGRLPGVDGRESFEEDDWQMQPDRTLVGPEGQHAPPPPAEAAVGGGHGYADGGNGNNDAGNGTGLRVVGAGARQLGEDKEEEDWKTDALIHMNLAGRLGNQDPAAR
jgi:hypothetical protein